MDDSTKFDDLSHDEDFKSIIREFEGNLDQVEKLVQNFCALDTYDSLTPVDKVRYALFQSFAINSLYWFYLRINGIDPNQHEIKSELNRVKEYMIRSKKIYEKQTLMPKIDQDAAKRFIRSSLWVPNQFSSDDQNTVEQNTKSRKRKREADDDDDDDYDSHDEVKCEKSENSAK